MKTFVIFDRQTGEVLQVHVQADDLHGGPRELVRHARPGAKMDAVDVMEVADLTPGASYRVDVKARKLVPVEGGAARGAAGASLQPLTGELHTARQVVMYQAGRVGGSPTGAPEQRGDVGRQAPAGPGQS